MRCAWVPWVCALLLAPRVVAADCDPDCVALRASEASTPRAAVEVLKAGLAAHPDDPRLPLLLAHAYLQADNPFWAIKTLQVRRTADPSDCGARALLAWVYLKQAALGEATAVLAEPGCSAETAGPDGARLALVAAHVQAYEGRADDAAALIRAARSGAAYDEDRAALPALRRRLEPDGLPDLTWRVEVGGGYTTNALLGSPTDAASRDASVDSALLQADAWLRFSPWLGAPVRPSLEGQIKVSRLLDPDVEGLSTLVLTGRAGLIVGEGLPRVLFAYRPEALLLTQGDRYDDGPVWFFEAHRAEVEVEVAPWLLVFGGAGQRMFREEARTRTEADVGLGGALPLGVRWLGVLWASSGRVYRADEPAYNLWGLSVLLSASARLPEDVVLRLSGTFAADWYPDSTSYPVFFPRGGPDPRRDLFGRGSVGVWTPSAWGLRVGAEYVVSTRGSTADAYAFTDHRALLRVTWSGDADVLLPSDAGPAPVPLDWGVHGRSGALDDRVQDLLRQDEQVQRASSCVQ